MKKNYYKYLIIFFTFSFSLLITLYTFKSYVPNKVVPEIHPENTKNKIITPLPSGEKKLEIYNIVNPNIENNEKAVKKNPESEIKENKADTSLRFKLQLGSLRDKSEANKTYKKIMNQFPELFKEKTPIIEEVSIKNNGTFFRIKTFDSFTNDKANKICKKLISRNQRCLVTKIKRNND